MQVSVEKVNNVLRRLTIIVPVDQIEEAYASKMNHFIKTANIKGFRPGKAPRSYVEERFGKDARQEALGDVMRNAFVEAVKEQNLKPVSAPQIEAKTVLANQPFEFVASFEVLPDIEKINFAMNAIEKLVVNITEKDVDQVIDQLCKQHAKWNAVDRVTKENDRVVIDYHAVLEGKADLENKIEKYPLILGSKTMIPGFEEGLLGVKVGDEKALHLTFPEDFPVKDKAGKPVEFIVQVKQVFEANIPALDEEFIKRLGIPSGQLEDLKSQINKLLTQERDRLVKEKLKEQVFNQLLEQNPLEVPNALIADEAKNIHDEIYPQHQHHDHHQHTEQETEAFKLIAKKRIALGLLINAYAKEVDIKPDADEVRQRIQDIAAAYEHPEEVIQWLSTDEQRRSGIEGQVIEDQVLNKLMEHIPVTEKTLSYADLKGVRN